MKTFKVLGLLLTYPEGSLYRESESLMALLREEGVLPKKAIGGIEIFFMEQKGKDLLYVQEDYVDTFDRGRAHCLHLFEHIHGESRMRGQAMVDLRAMYEGKGLYIEHNELPDYLPLFMEYLSYCSLEEARSLLGEAINVISMLHERLKDRGSSYAYVLGAIEVLSAVKPDLLGIRDMLKKAPEDPETLEELDEEWREKEAFSCGTHQDAVEDCGSCHAFPHASEALKGMIGEKR